MSGTAVAAIDLAVDPLAWAALGFSVDGDVCNIGATRLVLTGAGDGPVVPAWELIAPEAGPSEVDGLPTRWVTTAPQDAASAHPNTATRIDHVVVQTPDIDRTFAALEDAGMTLRRERNAGSTRQPLRQGFFRHGEAIVEVVGPAEPSGDGPASLWGIVVVVTDLDTAATAMGEALGRPRDAVQAGRRIATVRAGAVSGLPLALMTELEAGGVPHDVARGRAAGVCPA